MSLYRYVRDTKIQNPVYRWRVAIVEREMCATVDLKSGISDHTQ